MGIEVIALRQADATSWQLVAGESIQGDKVGKKEKKAQGAAHSSV